MTDTELGRHIRELLKDPQVDRVEVCGKAGKDGVRGFRQIHLTWTKQPRPEQIRPKT